MSNKKDNSNADNEKSAFLKSLIKSMHRENTSVEKKEMKYKFESSFRNKSEWNAWNHTREEMNILAGEVVDFIKEKVENTNISKNKKDFKYSPTEYEENKRQKITFVQPETFNYAKTYRTEEGLERILTVLSEDECKNQLVTLDRGHIDFVISKDSGTTFVELKQWKNDSNSPVYAIVESLKNYFLYKKLMTLQDNKAKKMQMQYEGFKVNELLILAPFEYYYSYWKANNKEKRKKWETLKLFVEELNKKLKPFKVIVSIRYIDIPYGSKENPDKDTWLGVMKSFDIHETTLVDFGTQNNKDKFNIIKDKLCEWHEFLDNLDTFIEKCENHISTPDHI